MDKTRPKNFDMGYVQFNFHSCPDHLKNEEELCFRLCLRFFSFFFHAKAATANNHRIEVSVYHKKAFTVINGTTLKIF